MKCPKCGSEIFLEDNDSSYECKLQDKIECSKCLFVVATTDKNGVYHYYNSEEHMIVGFTQEQIEKLKEIIQRRLDYHCDKTKYRYELGRACIKGFINDIADDFQKELISEVEQ